ncbi:MAG: hypothetical protein KDD67_11220 [Ignavibacteriae bacterium]|nr:hypothetical protein [Ignavibacteriota bacterium]MCB9215858.1 hypothetical protein [Ignavibacteria bacterium]
MTTQDLIIGHYEGTLTGAEQAQLESLIATSPETRTLFEQQGLIEAKLREESEELVPPFGLREATLGAALTGVASTLGGGIASWFTAKVVIGLSTVIIGGAAIGLGIALSGDDDPVTTEQTTNETPGVVTSEGTDNTLPATDQSTSIETTTSDVKVSNGSAAPMTESINPPISSKKENSDANSEHSEVGSGIIDFNNAKGEEVDMGTGKTTVSPNSNK